MIYHLLYPLHTSFSAFNVFRYITFRTIYASLTAFLICFLLGPWVIRRLKALQIGQYIQEDGPESHYTKAGTPTMGGVLILCAVLLSTLMWANLSNMYVWIVLIIISGYGAIGFMDDYLKIIKKQNKGFAAGQKFLLQAVLAVVVGSLLYLNPDFDTRITIPFFKKVSPDLGWGYVIFAVLVIVGTSNAVNLTDGLDGLAIGCVVFITLTYAVISYITGNAIWSKYLQIFYLPGSGELTIFCAALTGAGLGFLWFNSHPATIFMGDTGSLALGGSIAIVSVLIKKEVLLLIAGGVLVAEALSVILQVLSFRFRKKRVFLMSPIHHHFQIKGLAESKITVRFWIIAAILALLSMTTLKVR